MAHTAAAQAAPSSRPTLYLAGPMTGLPEFNYPAFRAARAKLEAAGYRVLSPVDNDADGDFSRTWEWYMRAALRQLAEADAVAVLPGAACSRGASLEIHVARALGMTVRPVSAWLGDETADLEGVVSAFLAWAEQTFPEATAASCVEHLRREVAELQEDPTDPEELADAAMLVFHAAFRARVDLVEAIRAKLEKNRRREWGEPDEFGVREHVR